MAFQEKESDLVTLFHQKAKQFSSKTALLFKKEGLYHALRWDEWQKTVLWTALGLYHLGVKSGDPIAILSENCPEWTFADLGILSLKAVVVPIYPTSSAQDILYILNHAKVKFLFLSDPSQLEKIRSLTESLPFLRAIILFRDCAHDAEKKVSILSFETLLQSGKRLQLNDPGIYEQLSGAIAPDDLATIIYTSGTTGPPKGVMLTHRNFMSNYWGSRKAIHVTEDDIALSFLPLSHVFERLAGYYFMIFSGATIAYAENKQTVADDMKIIRPTIAAAVPRFYEKIYAKVLERLDKFPQGVKRWMEGLLESGISYRQAVRNREPISLGFKLRYVLAKILIFNSIKRSLGGRIRFFISGEAPLNPFLAEFFYAAGILILEGYGLTETSPVITVNREDAFKFGTVGKPIDFVEVRIDPSGEILTKGPCVMKGYFDNEEATREALRDGWFHTGDVGCFDEDGFLKITDRIKDIIATSGGKKVSPQNIEKLLLQDSLFSQAVVLGDRRHYLVALIVPKQEKIMELARELDLEGFDFEKVIENSRLLAEIHERIQRLTGHLASYERIKYFRLIPKEFTMASGELTPTLKIKRKLISERYKSLIDAMYRPSVANAPGHSQS